jgi:hypothetical protein
MNEFEEKLLLKVNALSVSPKFLQLNIIKKDNNIKHLLPFSCVSLIGSQLSVLSSHHPRSLSKKLLTFIDYPKINYIENTMVSGFTLEIYEGKDGNIYNQFDPTINTFSINNPSLETDIEHILINYVISVFEKSDTTERSNLRVFVLYTILIYQNEIIPIIKKINLNDFNQRVRLARTINDFSANTLKIWGEPLEISPGNKLFKDNMKLASEFQDWL